MPEEDVVEWRTPPAEEWIYCPRCATGLVDRMLDGATRRWCPACGFVFWARPLPAAACLVVNKRQLLLVQRRYPPAQGEWSLPGGGIELGETPEEAARREVAEETGLSVCLTALVAVLATDKARVMVNFYAAVPRGGVLRAGSDALEARFFDVEALPPLCFDTHRQAVRRWLEGEEQPLQSGRN